LAKVKTFHDLMQDKFGDAYDKVFIEQDNEEEKIDVISTGSLSLNASIGIGGIPRRRFTVIDGVESSGKTTLAFSIVREFIKTGGKALYVDVENQMSYPYIESLIGVENIEEGLTLAKPETSDDAFNICEAAINSKEFGLIILDSVAALSPPEEKKKEFEDANMAIIPRDLAKFFRRNSYNIRLNNIAFVFINQVRDLIGSYVKAYSTPGGHALKHYASVIISLSKGQEIKAGEESIGINTKFVVKKNKLAPPFRSFTIPIIFGKGIDTLRDTVSFAEQLGVIQRGGAWYRFGEQTLGKGMLDTIQYLTENKFMLDKINEACYNIVGKYKTEEKAEGE
jgi:recombination protein RecA